MPTPLDVIPRQGNPWTRAVPSLDLNPRLRTTKQSSTLVLGVARRKRQLKTLPKSRVTITGYLPGPPCTFSLGP